MFAHYRPTACSAQDTTTMLCAASILVPHHAAPAQCSVVDTIAGLPLLQVAAGCMTLVNDTARLFLLIGLDWLDFNRAPSLSLVIQEGGILKIFFSNKLILSQKWTNICLSSLYNNLKLSWRGENVNPTPLTSSNRSVQWGPANSPLAPSVLFFHA